MNDPAANGRGIRQELSFKSRSQRDAGPEWQQFSPAIQDSLGLVSKFALRGGVCPASPPRVAGQGIKPTGGNHYFAKGTAYRALLFYLPDC